MAKKVKKSVTSRSMTVRELIDRLENVAPGDAEMRVWDHVTRTVYDITGGPQLSVKETDGDYAYSVVLGVSNGRPL